MQMMQAADRAPTTGLGAVAQREDDAELVCGMQAGAGQKGQELRDELLRSQSGGQKCWGWRGRSLTTEL